MFIHVGDSWVAVATLFGIVNGLTLFVRCDAVLLQWGGVAGMGQMARFREGVIV